MIYGDVSVDNVMTSQKATAMDGMTAPHQSRTSLEPQVVLSEQWKPTAGVELGSLARSNERKLGPSKFSLSKGKLQLWNGCSRLFVP